MSSDAPSGRAPGGAIVLPVELPEWHETGIPAGDVVGLTDIVRMEGAPKYAALRSYSTGRREHALLGPMPDPVCRISNRRVWLRTDVEHWLTCPIPAFRRSRRTVQRWIDAGRPRGATMPATDGRSPQAT